MSSNDLVFDDWYEKTYPTVLAAVAFLCPGDLARAEDATCDAFVKSLERWTAVSNMQSPAGWTTRVAINLARRRFRSLNRCSRLNIDTLTTAVPEATTNLTLEHLLEGLSARQREALVLRYIEDLPQADIARRMGVAPGTVAATLNQARSKVRSELERNDRND